ncbi:MAG: 2-oxoglutarate dehydrogenase E1 component [Bacteroidota bacterium]
MDKFSYISNAHPDYIENLYKDYQIDPKNVDEEFKKFFEGFEFASTNFNGKAGSDKASLDELKVLQLIYAYRNRGHLIANTNPLKPRKDRHANLDLSYFGLTEKDLDRKFHAGEEVGAGVSTLRDIIDTLQKRYCKTMGFEFNYVRDIEEWKWLRSKIEINPNVVQFSIEKKTQILKKLNQAVLFEQFLGKKYIGEKRFSLEGGEATIPAIHYILNAAAENKAEEVVIGMAHRGRLNVLANILGKTYEQIFSEFEGNEPKDKMTMGDGDVKYHLGYSSNYVTDSGKKVYVNLTPNPSHLEAVDPIMLGYTRAQADSIYESNFDKIIPLMIHGDAAVAGQGIVYEVLQMAKLKGYSTGGTIHFVINNQIGFTTDFDDARSSDYCTSIAATIHAPVIHVNGDDIEAVVFAAEMAAEYRQKFNKDIFVDLVCYRKHGHNESDDPKFTQPSLYKLISEHENPRNLYSAQLAATGEVGADIAKKLDEEFWNELQKRLDMVKEKPLPYVPQPLKLEWQKLKTATQEDFEISPPTAIDKKMAKTIIEGLCKVPDGFTPLKKVDSYLKERRVLMQENKSVDWAAAELMGYSSLLMDGILLRLSGEDVKRGTFSHRHACIFDENTNEEYNRLSKLSDKQAPFYIYNSHLSEYGVLGFDYGYSLSNPNSQVIWEGQFGDFANTCQVIIDQFIASAESKWNRMSGLMMLLPHGYEGQGPEHSSARLERYLQLCAELNMVVVNITSPANFFHAIRRQHAWNFRKPLIVMSPKSLLRGVQDPIEKLFEGGFKEIIDDENVVAKKVRKVILCSGRLYVDLAKKQKDENISDVAIVRLEQLYPLAYGQIDAIMKKYKGAAFVWVQEEPANMGAQTHIMCSLGTKYPLTYVSRKASASPATGFKKQHKDELYDILKRAFS